uniref:Transcriptional activator protein n=1 Tax=Tomato yellow leaf curl Kanchanaburi virus TaxID=266799 RepID=A0A1B1UU83_9GEMI|nr:transcriptional activator protein [Tomato yellow leaf curl Kanchanaburi virus]ANW06383.1 transcriptional activator protein [Tomato yellow leaf curl Kanchanaburi virus]
MQNSSPSNSHSTIAPVKVQHKIAKKKIPRRRRVDLDCGCSYYVNINCHKYGFTHRGNHYCSSSAEWRVYVGSSKSPVFQGAEAQQQTIQRQQRLFGDTDPIQPQPQEGVGDSQVFPDLQNMDSFTTSDLAFLKSI